MITSIEAGRRFHVTGHTQSQIDHYLNTGVELARQSAHDHGGIGILVTRHGPGSHTVALNPTVPTVQSQPFAVIFS
jgi:hypothetical protein